MDIYSAILLPFIDFPHLLHNFLGLSPRKFLLVGCRPKLLKKNSQIILELLAWSRWVEQHETSFIVVCISSPGGHESLHLMSSFYLNPLNVPIDNPLLNCICNRLIYPFFIFACWLLVGCCRHGRPGHEQIQRFRFRNIRNRGSS